MCTVKRASLILLASLAILAALLGGYLLARPGESRQRLERTQSELAAANAELVRLKAESAALRDARAEIAKLTGELTELRSAQKELAASKKPEATPKPAAKSSTAQASGGYPGKNLRKMMEAPGMREMMKKQQATQVTMTYAGLIDQLDLDDQEKEAFKQLLADGMAKKTEIGMKMMDDTLTPAQRQAIQTEMKAADDASNAAIRSFLNDDTDYQTFQSWEETLPERTQMNMIGRSLFASSNEPLTPDQEEQLIAVMANARKTAGAQSAPSSPDRFDPATFTPEGIQKALQQYDAQAQAVAQGAASVLSPGQLETFTKMQAQFRSMTETGLQMSAAMFGGAPAK
jgi:hypothetical protein